MLLTIVFRDQPDTRGFSSIARHGYIPLSEASHRERFTFTNTSATCEQLYTLKMSYYCNGFNCDDGGLGYGARVGIGIGIAVVVVLAILLFSYAARRRKRRFIQQPSQAIPMAYQNNQPPTNYYQGYNNGFAPASPYSPPGSGQAYGPPPGAPPPHDDAALYAPPPGPPPPAYVPREERKNSETDVHV